MSIGVCLWVRFRSLERPLGVRWMSVQGLLKVQCIGSSFGRSFGLFIGSRWQSIRGSVSRGVHGGPVGVHFGSLYLLVMLVI